MYVPKYVRAPCVLYIMVVVNMHVKQVLYLPYAYVESALLTI